MNAKAISAVLITIGVIALLTSLVYANSGGATPKLSVPKVNAPRLELSDIDTPQIKLPLIGVAKLTNAPQKNNATASQCSGTALCTTDKITRIIDGDTIYTERYKIRLALTNTPEKGTTGFPKATAFTSELCPVGSTISIDQDDGQKTDTYGRMVAKVTCSGKNLNAELLSSGHASILKQYCAKSEFATEPWAKKFGC